MTNRFNHLRKAKRYIKEFVGKLCWDVGCGRNVGSSFSLQLGRKVKVNTFAYSKTPRKLSFRTVGEHNLLVWCSWRLSKKDNLVVTSDDCENHYKWCKYLRKLAGHKITKAKILNSFFDMQIDFTDGYQLNIFCDHGTREPSIDTNWEIFWPDFYPFGIYPKEWAQKMHKSRK